MLKTVRNLLFVCLLATTVVQLGCWASDETPAELATRKAKEAVEEQKRLAEERDKADLLLLPTTTYPSSHNLPSLYLKPGHWNSISLPIKAQQIDFDGNVSQMLTDPKGQPLPIDRTRYRLSTNRPLVIAKDSIKQAESLLYCPPNYDTPKQLDARVTERRGGRIKAAIPSQRVKQLLDHQYHFVVLAKEPARYGFLESLHAVTTTLPSNQEVSAVIQNTNALPFAKNYRVVAIRAVPSEIGIPLPDNPIVWTSTAYLLWDEVDPALLRPEQRDAIVDWITWGGQLIINGPDSIDLLRGSFLEPLLPAESTGSRRITAEELGTMNSRWNVSSKTPELAPAGNWTGIGLAKTPTSSFLPGLDNLLAERRVGRGRIVVSGFQLAQPQLLDWAPGIENLYNNAVLRRSPRRFATDQYGSKSKITIWLDKKKRRTDPTENSKLRLLMRDTHVDEEVLAFGITNEDGVTLNNSSYVTTVPPKVRGGVGSWNDFHLASETVRATLRESSGVSIPSAGFVALCLLAYLVVLVPINGYFFHALGRVELAWVAAPVIAILGAIAVIHQAQLDVGLVRSQTEIAVLEMQPDSPRGVLTRFTALYASLSTPYELEFSRKEAVAVPFSSLYQHEPDPRKEDYQTEVTFTRQERSRLQGLVVSSTSTEFVRSEEIVNIEEEVFEGSTQTGGIRMGKARDGSPRLENRTKWNLESVMVVQRPDGVKGAKGSAVLEGCWIGSIAPGESGIVTMTPIYTPPSKTAFAQERVDETIALRRSDEDPQLESLMALALDPNRFEPGERRVVARIRETIDGLTVTPAASQRRGSTLYVGHLNYGPLPPPLSDANPPTDN